MRCERCGLQMMANGTKDKSDAEYKRWKCPGAICRHVVDVKGTPIKKA